jgi:hypothetical protein
VSFFFLFFSSPSGAESQVYPYLIIAELTITGGALGEMSLTVNAASELGYRDEATAELSVTTEAVNELSYQEQTEGEINIL